MKFLKLITILVLGVGTVQMNAQSADEIIDTYFENTGGKENWEKIEGVRMTAKVNQGGMEIPLEIIQLKDGRQMTTITFQGQEMKQGVFDGETLWSTNFQSQKAEKSDPEATANFKLDVGDFPDPFLNYKEKGYSVELLGKEEFEGTETFKIKLTKKPKTIDGNKEENISYYFFDTENYVPIAVHSAIMEGQAKGMVSEIKFSDYQEVGDIYFPYTISQGIKGQGGQAVTLDTVDLNPEVNDADFKFPEEAASEEAKDKN